MPQRQGELLPANTTAAEERIRVRITSFHYRDESISLAVLNYTDQAAVVTGKKFRSVAELCRVLYAAKLPMHLAMQAGLSEEFEVSRHQLADLSAKRY